MSNRDLDGLFFEADQLIKDGNYSEAMDILDEILAEDPQYGPAYNHFGWIYETKYKDYGKAEDFYKKAIGYRPDYPAVYINLAVVLSTLEKYDELEKLLLSALTIPGVDKASVNNEFGIMYELKGEFLNAIRYYKEAIRTSLSEANIETYRKSINRCRTKKEIFEQD